MSEIYTVKQSTAELRKLRRKAKRIKAAIRKSRTLPEIDNLSDLLDHVGNLIDLNLRRTEEMRLDGRIKASEKIERAIGSTLQKMHVGDTASKLGVSLLHVGWTRSLENSRLARRKEQEAILDVVNGDVAKIRRI